MNMKYIVLMLNRIPELHRAWIRTALVVSVILPLLWVGLGLIFGISYFDSDYFANVRVLNKADALSYLAVVYAVQIPIFILFLEQMSKAERVYKIVLPRIFWFKEIMLSMVIFGLMVVMSPRSSYLYFPVIAATIVNVIAIFRALSVTFQFKQYINKIEKHINKSSAKSTSRLIGMRKDSNSSYSAVEESPFIYNDYHSDNPDLKEYEVKALKNGYFTKLDAETVNSFFKSKISNGVGKTTNVPTSTKKVVLAPHLDLNVYHGQKIKPETLLAKIIAPENTDFDRLAKVIRSAVRPKDLDHSVLFFDELLAEVEIAFADSLRENSLPSLRSALGKYFLVVDGLDSQINKEEAADYNFDSAKAELNRWSSDDLRSRIYKSFEILYDLGQHLVSSSNLELTSEFITHVYSHLLYSTEQLNKTASIRYESILLHLLGLFVYKNEWNSSLTKEQESILNDLLFRLKEHTSTLPYMIERVTKDDAHDNAVKPYLEFMKLRIDSLRSLALASVKYKKREIFQSIIEILIKLDDHYERKLGSDFIDYLRCNIMLIYAYINQKDNQDYIETLEDYIGRWQPEEVVRIVLLCSKENYADKWRVDTFDHESDGVVMRSVTNHDLVLRSVLVNLLLKKTLHDNIEFYGDKETLQNTTFFTDGLSSDNDNTIMKMVEESDSKDSEAKTKLKSLVKKFISLRRQWEHDQLAQAELDSEEIEKFRNLVNKKYLENSMASKLINANNTTYVKDPKARGYKRIGINQVYDKAAFINEWHIGYANDYAAEQLGENIAQTQDNDIVHSLLKRHQKASSLDNLLKNLKSKTNTRWFVYGNEIGRWDVEYRLKDFASVDKNNNLRFKGVKVGYSNQHFGYIDYLPKGLYFIDLTSTGSMSVKASDKNNPVEVSIESYSLNKRLKNEITKSPPEWLKEKGSRGKQEEFLDTKVRMLVNYVYKFNEPVEADVWFLPIDEY